MARPDDRQLRCTTTGHDGALGNGVLAIVQLDGGQCPMCGQPSIDDEGGGACEPCEVFQCAWCLLWVSWDVGGADDLPGACSVCWGVMQPILDTIRGKTGEEP